MPRSSSLADQMIGIVGLEGQAQQRRDRAQRDVALVPVEAQPDHFAALELALADDAGVDHRRRVGAGFGAGQPEAGNVAAVGEARQPLLLLLLGAEPHQQFAGPSEFGTITVTAAVTERVEILRTTSECA